MVGAACRRGSGSCPPSWPQRGKRTYRLMLIQAGWSSVWGKQDSLTPALPVARAGCGASAPAAGRSAEATRVCEGVLEGLIGMHVVSHLSPVQPDAEARAEAPGGGRSTRSCSVAGG